MSKVINISDKLGKLLLEGWAEGCCGAPLLRAPEGHDPATWFCPSFRDSAPSQSGPQQPPSPSLASSTHYSRSSTPPTEESHGAGSPILALPVETEESIRRRRQSDFASAEIGNRLLKGWAMLADECPRSTCYGIPLVRPPNSGRDKDPRKECVVCGTVYVTEKGAQGLDSLIPITPSGPMQEEIAQPSLPIEGSGATGKGKGKEKVLGNPGAPTVAPSVPPPVGTLSAAHPTVPGYPATSVFRESNPPPPTSSNLAFSKLVSDDILANSNKALGATLSVLSQRLLLLSGQPIPDPIAISQIADAIARTGQALVVINTLRRNQEQ
ncbi:hypothetical protein BJV78DRAFT_1280275 [Lactifluus subvellereus]|nr:hypothetical protein BJV78DRAFT_1280275 [Lactifluus subvellereus]